MKTYKYLTADTVAVFDEDGISRMSGSVSIAPEGASIEQADPQPNPRIAEIDRELAVLDQKKIRALADAVLKNSKQRLQDLETQADALRAERASL